MRFSLKFYPENAKLIHKLNFFHKKFINICFFIKDIVKYTAQDKCIMSQTELNFVSFKYRRISASVKI